MKKLASILLAALVFCGAGAVGAAAMTMEEPWAVIASSDTVQHYEPFTAPEAGWYTFYTKDPVGGEIGLGIIDPLTNQGSPMVYNTTARLNNKPVPSNTGTAILPFYLEEGQEVKVYARLPVASGNATIAVRKYDQAVDYAGLELKDKTITLLRSHAYNMTDCVSGVIPGTNMTVEYEENGVLEAFEDYALRVVPKTAGTCKMTLRDAAGSVLGQSTVTVKKASVSEWFGWFFQRVSDVFVGIYVGIVGFFYMILYTIF